MFKGSLLSNSIICLSVLCSSLSATVVQAKPTIELLGEIQQGGLIVGKTSAENKVMLNDTRLPVTKQGNYVFGFSRDDNTQYQLVITEPDGSHTSKTITPKKREYKLQRIEGIKKSIMQPNPKAVARSKKDSKQIRAARKISSEITSFAKGFIPPINGTITGVYGSQRIYNGVPKRPHFGLDYAGKIGDPVKAPASGKILLWVPDMFYSGGTLIIDHGHGISSTMLHLSKSYVKKGDIVNQGEVIAAVGNSGRVTGPHLDWRINWFDVKIDPALVLKIPSLQ
ncbi:M23 family metallopeptidase [Colwellia sp. KU-HH00111]|uniref:M23 family metallopeptidase n=1 Tax=Colwellia sp. KU-HH00111 TaxID=3127652 RepID=UPI0031045208